MPENYLKMGLIFGIFGIFWGFRNYLEFLGIFRGFFGIFSFKGMGFFVWELFTPRIS